MTRFIRCCVREESVWTKGQDCKILPRHRCVVLSTTRRFIAFASNHRKGKKTTRHHQLITCAVSPGATPRPRKASPSECNLAPDAELFPIFNTSLVACTGAYTGFLVLMMVQRSLSLLVKYSDNQPVDQALIPSVFFLRQAFSRGGAAEQPRQSDFHSPSVVREQALIERQRHRTDPPDAVLKRVCEVFVFS